MFIVQSAALTATGARLVSVSGQVEQEGDGILLLGCSLGKPGSRCRRVQGAISAAGLALPDRLVTVEATPRDLSKPMAVDLSIAVAALGAAGSVPRDMSQGCVFYAGLGIDGNLQAVPGVRTLVTALGSTAFRAIVVAATNADEARNPDVEVMAAETLAEVIARLRKDVGPTCRGRSTNPGRRLGVSQ